MTAGLLALVALLAHYAPEHVAAMVGGTEAAWSYVAAGVEAFALWCAVGLSSRQIAVRAVSAWGAFESIERFGCRLAFPMDRPPRLAEGQNLCEAATGMPTGWLGFIVAMAVVVALSSGGNHGR